MRKSRQCKVQLHFPKMVVQELYEWIQGNTPIAPY